MPSRDCCVLFDVPCINVLNMTFFLAAASDAIAATIIAFHFLGPKEAQKFVSLTSSW
jgi:hypothetical protein